MCRRVQCGACGKPSYAGCGMHVEQVLSDVPREDRCRCKEPAPDAEKKASPSLLDRLFGGAPKPR